ncbi:MAG: ATP-grasp domain-containing protein [Candidatus Omnitrophica bacterium]|nr:ATP-grasp domain-containing protein [Candidatus Omnitrophota bacterium]
MQIALTYNLKKKDSTKPVDYFSEFDSEETISAITGALSKKGHRVLPVNVSEEDVFFYFRKNPVDIVFNIAEGNNRRLRESEVPAILDYLKIPYTGSSAFALALALNKALTKRILKSEEIPTPDFQVFIKGNEELNPDFKFPLIVKPNREGSAKGISADNVVRDVESAYSRIKYIINTYRQEALVEEFIEGRELTVGILENGKTTVLPVLEIDFSSCSKSGEYFYSWKMKEYQGNAEMGLVPTFHCPARLSREEEECVKEAALKTHRAVGCFDISRTDIRLDKKGVPYVLEINPLPGLNPRESNFPMMAYAAGMQYEDIIGDILMSACKRREERN